MCRQSGVNEVRGWYSSFIPTFSFRLVCSHPLHNTHRHAGALLLQPLSRNPPVSYYSTNLSHNHASPFSHIGIAGDRGCGLGMGRRERGAVLAEHAINIADGRHSSHEGAAKGGASSFMSVCWYGRWFERGILNFMDWIREWKEVVI